MSQPNLYFPSNRVHSKSLGSPLTPRCSGDLRCWRDKNCRLDTGPHDHVILCTLILIYIVHWVVFPRRSPSTCDVDEIKTARFHTTVLTFSLLLVTWSETCHVIRGTPGVTNFYIIFPGWYYGDVCLLVGLWFSSLINYNLLTLIDWLSKA